MLLHAATPEQEPDGGVVVGGVVVGGVVVGGVVVGGVVVGGVVVGGVVPVLPPNAFFIATSYLPLAIEIIKMESNFSKRHTVSLRGVPKHDTAERGILATCRERDVGKSGDVNIARAGSSA